MFVLIGGADDKRTQEVLEDILKNNNVKKVLIIPTATKYQSEAYERYRNFFRRCGCDVESLFCTEDDCYTEFVENADFIFMTGGNQKKLIDKLKNTKFTEIIKKRLKNNDKIIISGTSAGAMSVSDKVIFDNERIDGFNFLRFTIDTHFSERNRLLRLINFMNNENVDEAIGIDEDTVVIVNKYSFEVYGKGNVYFIEKTFNNEFNIKILRNNDILNK